MIGEGIIAEESKTYRKVSDHATNMIATIRYGDTSSGSYIFRDSLKYAYDVMGNISKVYENGKLTVSYTYDNLNRLVREDNKLFGKTWLYTYDNNGNILLKEEYEYCIKEVKELADALVSSEYCYKAHSDQLLHIIKRELAENGTYNETAEEITYDRLGNPLSYRGKNLTWQTGRRLITYGEYQFEYDGFGKRIKLTAPKKDNENGTYTVEYLYDRAGRLIKQSNGLEFLYDHTGVMGLKYTVDNEEKYYFYRKDSQQNIVGILDNSGKVVVRYTYDSWGNHDITVLDSSCEQLANLNPFRYRSYYYDTETDLYFLKTRYYDPEIGRFISIDGISYLNPNAINGLNLYAYCSNNPVMAIDPNGTLLFGLFLTAVAVQGLVLGYQKLQDIHYNDRAAKNQEYVFDNHLHINEDDLGQKRILNSTEYKDKLNQYDFGVEANCHQFTASLEEPNFKVVTLDGFYEVIYDYDGNIVTAPEDMGTYNYCPSQTSVIGHAVLDVLPWLIWGNTRDDSTTFIQRVYYMTEMNTWFK
jgi:RHS repeat-associated protein